MAALNKTHNETLTDSINCYGPTDYTLQECHCGEFRSEKYEMVECDIIYQHQYEKGVAITILIYTLVIIAICTRWLYTFWNRRHHSTMKARRPFYLILSYGLIFPWILNESIATIYLYFAEVQPLRSDANYWTNWDGTPIIYSKSVDLSII